MQSRKFWLIGFLSCALMIGYALFAEYYQGMNPCPLCIFQRIGFLAIGFVFLMATIQGPKKWGTWVYGCFIWILCLMGGAVSLRHLWIQSLPLDQVPSCGAPLDFLMETRHAHGGLWGVIQTVLSGSGECAHVNTVLGLSMPWWALFAFIGLSLWTFFILKTKKI